MSMRRLRVAVLTASDQVSAWAAHMLEQIAHLESARVVLVIHASEQPTQRLPSNILSRLYQRLDQRLYRGPDPFDLRPLADVLPAVPAVSLRHTDSQSFLSSHDLDVIVALAPWDQLLLSAARYGVWVLQHGGLDVTTHGFDGLVEVLTDQSIVESRLCLVNADGRHVLSRTFSACDRLNVTRNRSAYYWKGASLVPRALQRLHDAGPDFLPSTVATESPAFPLTNARLLHYFLRFVVRALAKKMWQIGSVDQWILLWASTGDLPRSSDSFTRLSPPADRIWADPHIVMENDRHYVFIEEKPYDSLRGHISVMTLDDRGEFTPPSPVLRQPHHLSYPFVFSYEGQRYMIPEASQSRRIDVYCCKRFPDHWEYHATLMNDVVAFDTTLYSHGGRWWLFTNLQSHPGASSWDELFLYHADSPLSPVWIPHPLNPVVSDVRSARPAGPLFEWNNALIRPSQDGSRGYGYRVRFNRIVTLSERDYAEEELWSLEPDGDLTGLHSFSRVGHLAMIDGRVRHHL